MFTKVVEGFELQAVLISRSKHILQRWPQVAHQAKEETPNTWRPVFVNTCGSARGPRGVVVEPNFMGLEPRELQLTVG